MPQKSRSWQSPTPPDRPRVTALSQALDLAQAPRLVPRMRRQPLPQNIVTVIRLAAGCRESLAAAVEATARDPDFLVSAAELYLRQVVCHAGADPHRVLGVPAQASRGEIRLHLREFVLWLHPDRNVRGGDRRLMERILAAWREVNGSEPVQLAAGRMPARPRSAPAFRPSWIPRPVPKARSRLVPAVRLRLALPSVLRLGLIAASLVIPSLSALAVMCVAEGLPRLRDEARVRPGPDGAPRRALADMSRPGVAGDDSGPRIAYGSPDRSLAADRG